MLDFTYPNLVRAREDWECVLDVAQSGNPDMAGLRILIYGLDDNQANLLVGKLIETAGEVCGDPKIKSVPLSGAIENCLKAGLSPNRGTFRGSILDYYSSPNTLDVYKRIINEFGGVVDEENQKLFLLKGLFRDANRGEFKSGLSNVFNYLITENNVSKAKAAGVPVLENWEQDYSMEEVVLANAVRDFLNKHPKPRMGGVDEVC